MKIEEQNYTKFLDFWICAYLDWNRECLDSGREIWVGEVRNLEVGRTGFARAGTRDWIRACWIGSLEWSSGLWMPRFQNKNSRRAAEEVGN